MTSGHVVGKMDIQKLLTVLFYTSKAGEVRLGLLLAETLHELSLPNGLGHEEATDAQLDQALAQALDLVAHGLLREVVGVVEIAQPLLFGVREAEKLLLLLDVLLPPQPVRHLRRADRRISLPSI